MISYLKKNQDGATWLVAVATDQTASSIILESGEPVISMGGWSGSDNAMTLAKLKSLVKSGNAALHRRQRQRPGLLELRDLHLGQEERHGGLPPTAACTGLGWTSTWTRSKGGPPVKQNRRPALVACTCQGAAGKPRRTQPPGAPRPPRRPRSPAGGGPVGDARRAHREGRRGDRVRLRQGGGHDGQAEQPGRREAGAAVEDVVAAFVAARRSPPPRR